MSIVVRCLRQFSRSAETITLEKSVVLPDVPTMGTRDSTYVAKASKGR
jgi:hypothetical protein